MPTGRVHEIEFAIEQNGEATDLRVSVTDHDDRTFAIHPSTVFRQRTERFYTKLFPNQHASELDEFNRSGIVWARSETVPNELLLHSYTMESRVETEPREQGYRDGSSYSRGNRPRRGGLRLRCWIESSVPVSASALTIAANGASFLRVHMRTGKKLGGMFYMNDGPVPDLDKLFYPHDGSGNLYYRTPPPEY